MRFWWVNQNQTFRQEWRGGYMWSPKRNSIGARNPFYDTMREVAPGDLIFSFVGTLIKSIGIARSYCYECPKPDFGSVGQNWESVGWRVDIGWQTLLHQIKPRDHIDLLRPQFPPTYSPLQESGDGKQSVYLAWIPDSFGEMLGALIGPEFVAATTSAIDHGRGDFMAQDILGLSEWEEHIEQTILEKAGVSETTKMHLVQARRGQGVFRKHVALIEQRCRITGVDNPAHLIASHCKPWRDASDEERLNGENGLMLTPSVDHLFDRGFISFENDGRLLISPVAHRPSLNRMGIEIEETRHVGAFSSGQKNFLDYHRNSVFLERRGR